MTCEDLESDMPTLKDKIKEYLDKYLGDKRCTEENDLMCLAHDIAEILDTIDCDICNDLQDENIKLKQQYEKSIDMFNEVNLKNHKLITENYKLKAKNDELNATAEGFALQMSEGESCHQQAHWYEEQIAELQSKIDRLEKNEIIYHKRLKGISYV
jgi:predicted RNase H-like nuclease (RuvC/YqgF family)